MVVLVVVVLVVVIFVTFIIVAFVAVVFIMVVFDRVGILVTIPNFRITVFMQKSHIFTVLSFRVSDQPP